MRDSLIIITEIILLTFIVVSIIFYFIYRNKHEDNRKKKILLHKSEWDDEIISTIINKKVSIGMNGEQVLLSLGSPSYTTKEMTIEGIKTRWVYLIPRRGGKILWFVNNELKIIQT